MLWGPEARYLFDTFGYVVLRGAMRKEAAAMLEAFDAHRGDFYENNAYGVKNASHQMFGLESSGRLDCGKAMMWPKPQCLPFRGVLDHPELVPALNDLVGQGYRLDHQPICFMQPSGAEGFDLHGGPQDKDGRPIQELRYTCTNGHMYCSLLAVSVSLSTVRAGDGGFVCVPGSHKANFPLPDSLSANSDILTQPTLEPGDVLLFTEAMTHGAVTWKGEGERGVALYRFSPSNHAYGRRATDSGWPDMEDLTDAQRAALEPPYHRRLDRPGGGMAPRSQTKKDYDERVFGTTYF
jgi:ectoine hydroxylase-related dioxygenase (phytanoyl-CoA dioxygenase family)